MFGVTHSLEGELIIREPKLLKVGIGLPKGPALNVWIAPDKTWRIAMGYKGDDKKVVSRATRAEAEDLFNKQLKNAPVCPYPRKIGFFTFTRPIIGEDGREMMVPDFDAIEAHGPTPTEIDIVLLDDSPFSAKYQMWSSSELKCSGDGLNAMRLVTMATAEQKEVAQTFAAAGEKYFPMDGCWATGQCPYSKPTVKNGKEQPSECKPGGDLRFQLANNIRVGGTAYFHTTGFRSISGIFSSLHRVAQLTSGRLAGIPLKMVLRPFKSNHNGQAATQYAVSLEFRAPDVATLRKKLLETAFEFRAAAGIEAPRHNTHLIEAPAQEAIEEGDEDPPVTAATMAAEFYPEASAEDEPESDKLEPPHAAAAATATKTEGLADKLAKQRAKAPSAPPVAAEAPKQEAPAETVQPGQSVREDLF